MTADFTDAWSIRVEWPLGNINTLFAMYKLSRARLLRSPPLAERERRSAAFSCFRLLRPLHVECWIWSDALVAPAARVPPNRPRSGAEARDLFEGKSELARPGAIPLELASLEEESMKVTRV